MDMILGFVKGVIPGNAWSAALGWVLPVFLVLQAAALVVAPAMSLHPVRQFLQWPIGRREIVLVVMAVTLGLLLASIQTPLYRVLEGYLLWPQTIKERRTERHIQIRRALYAAARGETLVPMPSWRRRPPAYFRSVARSGSNAAEAEELGQADSAVSHKPAPLEQQLQWSRIRYPGDEEQIAPTALGNAIRRIETYAADRYHMDSQLLFHHLTANIPDSLIGAQERARTNVDFAVCLTWTSAAAAAVSLVTWLTTVPTISLLLFAIGGFITAVLAYQLAVIGTDEWAATMRAQVDLGRAGVAAAFGLTIPHDLTAERVMWSYVNLFVLGPYAETGTTPDWIGYFRSSGTKDPP